MDVYASTTRVASRTKHNGADAVPADFDPADFDPADFPIIAMHVFGVSPFPPIGEAAPEVVADLKYRRRVQRLHGLGDRVLGEFLAEIGAERGIQTVIDKKLDRYAELDPEAIEATGGDKFWPVPIHEVGDG